MSDSLFWKAYNAEGKLEAACKWPESAAAVVSILGSGATIRAQRTVLWTEGNDGDGDAANSWDHVSEVVQDRLRAHLRERSMALLRPRDGGAS